MQLILKLEFKYYFYSILLQLKIIISIILIIA